jgi:chitin disaccharide deacetylase
MLIINADDWGRAAAETDSALRCYKRGRITSVSAMVFMEDSERAAELAKENELDVGLHLNFTDRFTANQYPETLGNHHAEIIRFLRGNKYSQLLYNPFLRKEFAYSYEAQFGEFTRLYSKPPSHADGHHHMHLCANILLSNIIPAGMKMRRNFSFSPGEKGPLNRTYRAIIDRWLAHKYQITDYFFDLTQCIKEKEIDRVAALAKSSSVELMTHPVMNTEEEYLISDEFQVILQPLEIGGYALV